MDLSFCVPPHILPLFYLITLVTTVPFLIIFPILFFIAYIILIYRLLNSSVHAEKFGYVFSFLNTVLAVFIIPTMINSIVYISKIKIITLFLYIGINILFLTIIPATLAIKALKRNQVTVSKIIFITQAVLQMTIILFNFYSIFSYKC